jgi:hypothetical protein
VDADPLPQQQAALLVHHDQRAERGVERLVQGRAVLDGRDPVAALARLGRVGPAVLDQRGAAGLLLAQLEAAVGDAEVRVALGDHAAVLRPHVEADPQRAFRIRVGRLELDVAAWRGHRREPIDSVPGR